MDLGRRVHPKPMIEVIEAIDELTTRCWATIQQMIEKNLDENKYYYSSNSYITMCVILILLDDR